MASTYDPTLPTSKDKVRLLIGDNDPASFQMQDEEIGFFISSENGNLYGAAASACRALAAHYARLADTVVESVSVFNAARRESYLKLAVQLEGKRNSSGTGFGGQAEVYCGGISVADMKEAESDPDRVPMRFRVGQDDNPPSSRFDNPELQE